MKFNTFRAWLFAVCLALSGSWAQAQTTVDLIIVKSGPATMLNGETITYTLEISNGGPADANGATFSDPLPAGITNIAATCTGATLGAVCPPTINISGQTVSGTIPTLPNSGVVTIEVTGRTPVRAGPTSLSNTATTTAPAGRTETNPGTNSSTANTSMTYRPADLSATLNGFSVNGVPSATSYAFGDTISYTFTHTNLGPGPADLSRIRDSFAATQNGVGSVVSSNRVLTCTASGGAVCPPVFPVNLATPANLGTSGAFYDQNPQFWPSGGSLQITVSFQIDSYVTSPTQCGTADRFYHYRFNTSSSINGSVGGLVDPVSGNNTSTPTPQINGPLVPQPVCPGADLSTTKTQSSGTFSFDTPITYTVVHTNNGPGPADGGTIGDSALVSGGAGNVTGLTYDGAAVLSCVAAGGAVCPASFTTPAGGAGSLVDWPYRALYSGTVPTWPSGGSLTVVYQLTPRAFIKSATCGPVAISTGNILNTAGSTVPVGTLDPVAGNNSFSVTATGPQQANPSCPQADVAVTTAQDSTALVFGQFKEYTLTYTNLGPDAADGYTIRDRGQISSVTGGVSAINFDEATVSCVASGGAECPVLTVTPTGSFGASGATAAGVVYSGVVPTWPSGGVVTVTYRLRPTSYSGSCSGVARASLVNQGFLFAVAAPTVDPVAANNITTATSDPGPLCADLAVGKAVSPSTLVPGGPMSFTLDVSAPAAGNTVTGATLRDVLPSGFVFDGVSASCAVVSGTATCGSFTWNPLTREFASVIPSISPSAVLRWTLTGQAISYSSSWFNTAELILPSTFFDPLTTTNSATVSVNIQGADPKISKQSIDKQIKAGDPVRYRLTVSNPTDGGVLSNVSFQDFLPSGFTFASTTSIDLIGGVTQTSVVNPVVGSNTPSWGTYQVPAAGVIVIEFVANSPAALACGPTVYDNSARVDYTVSGTPDTRPYNGSLIGNSADDVTVPCPATVTKAYNLNTISSGNLTTLTFTVSPVAGNPPYPFPFNFTDTLPSGLRVWSLSSNTCGGTVTSDTGGSLTTGSQGIRITGGVLPSGGTAACQLRVNVTNQLGQFNPSCAGDPAAFTNGPGNLSGLENVENGVSNQCLVVNAVPLTLLKGISPGTIPEGETATVSLAVRNPPGHPATTVDFVDTLPSGWQVTSPSNLGGTCSGIGSALTISGNVVTANALPVADNTAGASNLDCLITFTVTNVPGQANATCSGNPVAWTNGVANITGRSANLTYNSAHCLVVSSSPTLNKAIAPAAIVDGDVTQLTFTLSNSPSAPAQTGINFTDALPAGWRVADAVVANTCGGSITNNANAALAAGMTSVRLTGGTLAAGQASCQIVVNITNLAGNLNASCASNPGSWTNQNANISGLSNLFARINAPQCLVVTPRPGTLRINKALTLPAGITGPLNFDFTATCNLPAAGTAYGPVTLSNYPTNSSVDIPGIPAGATCTVAETLPTAPFGYSWSTPVVGAFSPAGGMPAGAVQQVTVTNALVRALSLSKSVLSGPTAVVGNPLQHDITYRITVSNNTAVATTYSLSDTFGFDPDVSVVGTPTVTPGGGAGAAIAGFTGSGANTALVNNQAMAASAVHTFDVTVRIQMNAFNEGNNACDSTAGNGLLNSVTLTQGTVTTVQATCAYTPASVPVSLRLRKAWVGGASGDAVNIPATSGFSSNTVAFTASNNGANNTSDSAQVVLVLGETGTLPSESFTSGSALNYVAPASWVCANEDGTGSPTTVAQGGNLTVPADAAGKVLLCVLTNTGIGLNTVKTASPAGGAQIAVGDTIAYTLTTTVTGGATQQPLVLTDTLSAGLSLVSGPTVGAGAPAGSSCAVSGQVITCTLGTGAAIGTHTFTYSAQVTPAAVNNVPPGVINTVSPNVGTCSTCSVSNPLSALNFRLRKAFVAGVAGDAVNIPATSGFVNNTAAFDVVNTGLGISVASAAVALSPGISGTLPTESFTTGDALDYAVSQWVCQNVSGAGSVTNVAQGGTLTIPADATGDYTCTLTNTGIAISTTKTASPASGQAVVIGQSIDYTLATTITGAASQRVVTLTDTLSAGLSITGALPAGCTQAGQIITCTLPVGTAVGTHSFTYQATVTAPAVNNIPAGVRNEVTTSTGSCASCTTNHPVATTELVLRKQWMGGVSNDAVAIASTTGFVNNTAPFASVNTGTGNQSDSAAVILAPGLVGNLPTESFTVGDALDYQVSAWVCRNSDGTGAVVEVAQGASLSIPVASAGKRLICTLTNTGIAYASGKTATPAGGTAVTVGDVITYTLSTTVSGAPSQRPVVLTDTLSPGLTLMTTNLPTGCVPSTTNAQELTCTLAVGAAVGEHSFVYQARVNANAAQRVPPGVSNSVVASVGSCDPCTVSHGLVQAQTQKRVSFTARSGPEGSGVYVGDVLTFTITTTVSGGPLTQPLLLQDRLSEGLALQSVPAGCVAVGERGLDCTLAVGTAVGEHRFVYTAEVTDDAGEYVSNVVTPSQGGCDAGCATRTRVLREVMLRITKTASPNRVKIGDFVRYEVLVENLTGPAALKFFIVDQPGPGLSFVPGSLRLTGDDDWSMSAAYPLTLDRLDLPAFKQLRISYLMAVNAGAGRGNLCNKAWADDVRKYVSSNVASVCVVRASDPDFEDTHVLGTVFEDQNGNGVQDEGERGIAGARLATATGQLIETDAYGRYHIMGIDPGALSRGRNYIVKLDMNSVAAGSEMTTQNPQVKRLTWGLPVQFNFGVRPASAR